MSATECHQHTSDSSTDSWWLCSSDLLCMLWTLADLKPNPAVHCSPRSEDQIYQHWHETSVFGDSSTILSSADPLNFGFLNQKWPRNQIWISWLFCIWVSARSLPKCSEFILVSASTFCQASWKAASDCMRNANKSLNMQCWGKWKTDPESVSGTGSPPNANQCCHL